MRSESGLPRSLLKTSLMKSWLTQSLLRPRLTQSLPKLLPTAGLLKSFPAESLPRPRALAAVCAALLAALASTGCGGGCDERFVVDRASPEGYIVATIYVRDCGLGAEEMTHVNLRQREEKFQPDAGGRIQNGEVFTVAGHQTVYLGWNDERHLEIRCVGCGDDKVFKHEGSWKSVSISYADR
jgi:hypothetical protein